MLLFSSMYPATISTPKAAITTISDSTISQQSAEQHLYSTANHITMQYAHTRLSTQRHIQKWQSLPRQVKPTNQIYNVHTTHTKLQTPLGPLAQFL